MPSCLQCILLTLNARFLVLPPFCSGPQEHIQAVIKFLGMRTLTDRETDDLMKLGRFNAQSEKYPKMWPKTRKMLEVGAGCWGGAHRASRRQAAVLAKDGQAARNGARPVGACPFTGLSVVQLNQPTL